MCENPATSKEHVPPKCLFPEQKDVGVDYRKNLISVGSCDEHNTHTSRDDEYAMAVIAFHWRNNQVAYQQSTTKVLRALEKNRSYYDLFFGPGRYEFVVWKGEELVTAPVNIERFNSVMDKVARGLYFHHFKQKWLQGVYIEHLSLSPVYRNPDDHAHPINTKLRQIKYEIDNICQKQTKHGNNPDVFYCQVCHDNGIPPEKAFIRMVFYSGFVVIAILSSESHFDIE